VTFSVHFSVPTISGLLILVSSPVLVWLSYRYFLPGRSHRLFLILDGLAAVIIAAMLLQMDISLKVPAREKGRWAVLVDISRSMNLGPKGDTRLDRVKDFLQKSRFLRQLEPVWLTFGTRVKPLEPEGLTSLEATESSTRIGQALREAARHLGPRASGIVIISDGQETDLFPWETFSQQISCPVYCLAAESQPPPDTGIVDVVTNCPVYAGEKVQLNVSLRQSGFDGRSLPVKLFHGTNLVDQKTVQAVQPLTSVEFSLPGLSPGEYIYQVVLEPQPGETVLSNNRYPVPLRALATRIHLLYVETSLRWEYKFLKRYLESDPHLQPVFLVRVAENTFQQTGGEQLEIPADIFTESFLNHFDLLILGDFDFTTLSPRQLQAITEFVAREGKSLMLLGGEHFLKGAQHSGLETLLPVIPTGQESRVSTGEFSPVLTEEGKSFGLFEGLTSFPGLDRINQVHSIRPGASVLLVKSSDPKAALLAISAPGQGKCLILATDVVWKWYFGQPADKTIYELFWARLLRSLWGPEDYLGLGRSLPEIITSGRLFSPGETVEIRFASSGKLTGKVNYSVRTADGQTLPLTPVDNRASFVPRQEGVYLITAEAGGKSNLREVIVTSEGTELMELSPNEALLKKIAQFSHGGFFRLSEAHLLEKSLKEKRQFLTRSFGPGAENRKYWIALVCFVLNLCWWQRRRQNIV